MDTPATLESILQRVETLENRILREVNLWRVELGIIKSGLKRLKEYHEMLTPEFLKSIPDEVSSS